MINKIVIITICSFLLTACGMGTNTDEDDTPRQVEVSVQEIETMINSGNLSQAQEILVNLMSHGNNGQELYLLLAKCEFQMGNIQRALTVAQKAEELFGDTLKAPFFRMNGLIYTRLGRNLEAKRAYDSFISSDSSSWTAFNERGMLNMSLENYAAAASDFQSSLLLEPNAMVMNNLGHALYSIEEYDSALAYYNRSIAIDSSIAYTFFNRGRLYAEADFLAKGIRDLLKAEELGFPDELVLYMNMGLIYFELDDLENACECWRKSKEKGNALSAQLLSKHCGGSE